MSTEGAKSETLHTSRSVNGDYIKAFSHDDADTIEKAISIQEGQIEVKLLEKFSTFFRASRNDELPSPHWFEKEIERLEKESEDWSGRYFFLSPPNSNVNYFPSINDATAYAGDCVDESTGIGVYRIEQREVKQEFYAIVNNNRKHGMSAVTGDKKAEAIKHFFKEKGLGLIHNNDEKLSEISDRIKETFSDTNGKILPILDSLDLAYIGPHTEDEDDNELILGPRSLKKTKPKKIIQVLVFDIDETHESAKTFLENTSFEDSEKKDKRRQFLSKHVKLQYQYPEQRFLGASNVSGVTQEDSLEPDLVLSMQQHLDAKLKATEMKGIPNAETATGKESGMIMRPKNQYLTLMADMSPVETLIAVTEIVKIAIASPFVVASLVRLETPEVRLSSLLAGLVAGEGMAPLAEAWISLLHLLYEEKYLIGKEVLSALLPNKKQDTVKSLAHAIAGAAWSSKAASKLCTLLSEVASSDAQLVEPIKNRLSIKRPGCGFQLPNLKTNADFYKLAKHADNFSQNSAAIAQLKKAHLIPETRELYKVMVSETQAAGINWESSFEALLEKIEVEITPQVLALYNKMKEKAELEQPEKKLN